MKSTKTILITGSTSGIGLAIAKKFAQESTKEAPMRILLTGRRQDRLEKIKQELNALKNCDVLSFAFDIRERSAVEKFVSSEMNILKNLDILVNNAGLAAGRDPFPKADIADWEAMIDTNIKGLLYTTRSILPLLVKRGSGHIINIGSVAGHYTYPNGSVYCATKFAVRAITESLRMDLQGTPIRVSSVDPGMVETEFSLVRFKGDERAAQAVYKGMRPLRAEDIANTIYWISTQPPHVNIQEVLIMPTDQASVRDIARQSN